MRVAALFLVFLLTLTGCASPGVPMADLPVLSNGIPHIHAIYAESGGAQNLTVDLSGPVLATMEDGRDHPSYRLSVVASPKYPYATTYYLDGTLRIRRIDSICSQPDGLGCESALRRDYHAAGRLAPLGLGYLALIQHENSLMDWGNRTPVPIEYRMTKEHGEIHLQMSQASGQTADFYYQPGDWLPTRLGNMTRLSQSRGDPMVAADTPVRSVSATSAGAALPWDSGSPYAGGYDLRRFVEAAANNSDVHHALAGGACLVDAHVSPPLANGLQTPVPAPLPAPVTQNARLIYDASPDAWLVASVQMSSDQFGRTTATTNVTGMPSAGIACSTIGREPPATVSVTDAVANARPLGLSIESLTLVHITKLPSDYGTLGGRQPEEGWLRYELLWHPSNATGPVEGSRPYETVLDPWTGTWETITSLPGDLRPM